MKAAIICFPKIDWQVQFPIGIYKIKGYCQKEYNIFIIDERIQDAKKIEEMIVQPRVCELQKGMGI